MNFLNNQLIIQNVTLFTKVIKTIYKLLFRHFEPNDTKIAIFVDIVDAVECFLTLCIGRGFKVDQGDFGENIII